MTPTWKQSCAPSTSLPRCAVAEQQQLCSAFSLQAPSSLRSGTAGTASDCCIFFKWQTCVLAGGCYWESNCKIFNDVVLQLVSDEVVETYYNSKRRLLVLGYNATLTTAVEAPRQPKRHFDQIKVRLPCHHSPLWAPEIIQSQAKSNLHILHHTLLRPSVRGPGWRGPCKNTEHRAHA
jgi:hypothetical protein